MKVYIDNLSFKCIIGILDFERKHKQKVLIDISFKYKYKNNKFIDYSLVAKKVEKIMKERKFYLLEEAVLYLKKYLYSKYKVQKIKIKIKKPNILKNCQVSVEN